MNAEKTHILVMSTQRRLSNLNRQLEIRIDGQVLKSTKCEKLLGCTVSCNLKWNQQILEVQSRLSRRLSALKYLKFSCPLNLRKRFVDGLFNSILVYCLPVYGGMDIGQLHSLQILQNKAARLVLRAPPRSNREKMYKSLNWLSVNQLICYHSLISVFKIRLHKDPKYLSDKLNNNSSNCDKLGYLM